MMLRPSVKHRFLKHVTHALLVVAALCATGVCQTTKIDVSQCFSEVLVTHINQNVVEHYLYYYLAVIDESTFNQIKANSSATALLPAGLFSGDWAYFQEARRHYFELHNESIDYYKSLATNIMFLPPEWRGTIDNCINRLTMNSGYGVLYYPVYDDPNIVRLELKYRSTGNDMPRVKSSQVVNANVVDPKGQQAPLYRDCYLKGVDWTCPRLDSQNEFILRRVNPNEKVHVLLNLDNGPQSTAFDIDILPKKKQCASTYAHSPTLKDDKRVEIHHDPSQLLNEWWGSGSNTLQLFMIRLQYPGRITYATCVETDSYFHIMNNDPNQRDRWMGHNMKRNPDWDDTGLFQCLGMTNTGDKREAAIHVEYQAPQIECADIDWPAPSAIARTK